VDQEPLVDKIVTFGNSNNDVLNNKEMREEFIPCYCLMQRTIGLLLKKVNKNYYASTKLNDLLKILEQSGLSCFYVRLIISDSQNRNKMRTELEINIVNKDSNKRIDALYCLDEIFCTLQSGDEVKFLFKALLFSIIYDDDVLIYHNIDFLIKFIEQNNAMAKEFKILLMKILEHLAIITDYGNENSALSFDEKLIIRQRSMRLAYIMKKDADCSAEKEVIRWENESNDNNEFSDIRNKWM
jgi:hypothetical protein